MCGKRARIGGWRSAAGASAAARAVQGAGSAHQAAEQIVSARRAAMAMSLFVLGDLKKRAEQGAPASEQAFMARSLANWAKAVPGMFPAGTSGSDRPFDVHAKPEIWKEWPTFERLAADYIATTEKL